MGIRTAGKNLTEFDYSIIAYLTEYGVSTARELSRELKVDKAYLYNTLNKLILLEIISFTDERPRNYKII